MVSRHITILLFFLPAFLYGQRNDCFARQKRTDTVDCYLTPFKKINDTIIAVLPKNFGYVQFDSTVNGYWKLYLDDSITILEIVEIKDGKENGKCYRYFSTGKIREQSEYLDGKLNGTFILYNKTGKIDGKGVNANNIIKKGNFQKYWDNGHIASKEYYKNGRMRLVKYWNKDGKRIKWEKFEKEFNNCF